MTDTPGTSMTCIRRPSSTWTTCRCDTCRADLARVRKHARAGILKPARSDDAWAAIDRMLDAGMTPLAIATATRVRYSTLWRGISGRRSGREHRWSPAVARLIIDATEQPTLGYISALGARRRLRALAAIGHSVNTVTNQSGIRASTLYAIRAGATQLIRPDLDRAIRAAYGALSMRIPEPTRGTAHTQAKARREGWAPPLAWDEGDIDDPNAEPIGKRQETGNRGYGALAEDAAELVAQGYSRDAIAWRLGVCRDAIDKALTRSGASARGRQRAREGAA